MKRSKYYQRWLQLVSRSSTMFLFFSGYFLGKEIFIVAFVLLFIQLGIGFIISELMYRRLKAVVKEGGE